MIIPIRCFTCGKVVGSKWFAYKRKVKEYREAKSVPKDEEFYLDSINPADPTPEGKALNELGLHRYCCRRMILTHVNIFDDI
jgi:DNA-directed RNA polymerase subunit N (RpoN/RPB10)